MKRQLTIALLTLLCTAVPVIVCSQEIETPKALETAPHGEVPLSHDMIIQKVDKVFGQSRLKGWSVDSAEKTIETLVITDDNTPFVSKQLNDRSAIKVTLSKVPLEIAKFTGKDIVILKGIRSFDVYLDPATGQFLKIISTLDSYYSKLASGEIKKPSVEDAETQMVQSFERYSGFPATDPMPGFLEVLGVAAGNPLQADQIIAYFIEYERSGTSKPVWVIETYGVESIPAGRGHIEIFQLNRIRTLVDTDGQLMFWTHEPYATE